jgi:4-amino-4-deoxy-L-arabinose transferase
VKATATIIILLFIVVYILPLGVRPMIIPDETCYAEISREILNTGEWIIPKLNGLRYFEKPILGYWLNAASISTFGENAFSVGLPSAMAAGFSVLLIFLMVRKFSKGDSLRGT